MKKTPITTTLDFLPLWAKVILLCSLILHSSSLMIGDTFAAWQASDFIAGNSLTTGIWEDEDPEPQCFLPDTLGGDTPMTLYDVHPSEPTLQEVFDANSIALNASSSQSHYQLWTVAGATELEIEVELLGAHAGHAGVFGWYADGGDFEPMFKTKNHSGFPFTPIMAVGNSATSTLTASSSFGFAISTQNPANTSQTYLWHTETAENEDGNQHAVVYDLGGGEYVIAFEDLKGNSADNDLNDLIVRVSVVSCGSVEPEIVEPEEPGEPTPLATDGDVVLNEFLPNPEGNDSQDGEEGEWVELYNNEDFDIDLTDWYVTDFGEGEGNRVYISSTTAPLHLSPATTTIPANGFLVVYINKAVFNNPGDTVKLYNSLDQLKDEYEYGEDPTACENDPTPGNPNTDDTEGECNASNVPEGKSFARFIDGVGDWIDPEPTPGEKNRFSRQDLIDSGFSEEEIENMVLLLKTRGQYLIGEEPVMEPTQSSAEAVQQDDDSLEENHQNAGGAPAGENDIEETEETEVIGDQETSEEVGSEETPVTDEVDGVDNENKEEGDVDEAKDEEDEDGTAGEEVSASEENTDKEEQVKPEEKDDSEAAPEEKPKDEPKPEPEKEDKPEPEPSSESVTE